MESDGRSGTRDKRAIIRDLKLVLNWLNSFGRYTSQEYQCRPRRVTEGRLRGASSELKSPQATSPSLGSTTCAAFQIADERPDAEIIQLRFDPLGQAWAGTKAWTARTRVPSVSMFTIVASKGPAPLSATSTCSPATGGRSSSQQPGGTIARPPRTGANVRSATTRGVSSMPSWYLFSLVAGCATRVKGSQHGGVAITEATPQDAAFCLGQGRVVSRYGGVADCCRISERY